MWIAIFLAMIGMTVYGIIYIVKGLAKTDLIQKITRGNYKKAKIYAGILAALMMIVLYLIMGVWNVMIVFMHLLLIWMLADGIGRLIKKIGKKQFKHYIAGPVAILITVIYLAMGWYWAHHVKEKDYSFTTEKELGIEKDTLRIVGFADSHLGTTFHWEKFTEYTEQMNELHPDIVIISGDFVDDDSTKEDMIKCCEALGRMKPTYGVYFVYGNHDKGYYGSKSRGFDEAELERNLKANHVTVLRDEIVHVAGNIYVVGRLDAQVYDRKDMADLAKEYSTDNYVIVLDHEPNDYANEAAAKPDLVISGHTHGGQLIPITKVGEWAGLNDRTYGTERRDKTDFVVTSGISDWAIKFKTGCSSEFLVIDVKEK